MRNGGGLNNLEKKNCIFRPVTDQIVPTCGNPFKHYDCDYCCFHSKYRKHGGTCIRCSLSVSTSTIAIPSNAGFVHPWIKPHTHTQSSYHGEVLLHLYFLTTGSISVGHPKTKKGATMSQHFPLASNYGRKMQGGTVSEMMFVCCSHSKCDFIMNSM